MTKKSKIAVIGLKGLPAFGGAASVGENIIESLYDRYDFTVYSISSHTGLKTGIYNGICSQIVFSSIPFRRLNTLLYYLKASLHCVFLRYDIVHLHHRDASFIIPILKIRSKVVITTHGMILTSKWRSFNSFFKLCDKLFLGLADTITTVSKKDLSIVKGLLPVLHKSPIYIPNGINLISSANIPLKRILFAAGRIVPDKGCHLLLEALKLRNISTQTLILGDIDQMQKYKNVLVELSNSIRNVEFGGLIKDKTKLFDIIASSELFVYPSLIESMSMMLLEVSALGTPIICSRIQENVDIFDETEVLFFEPNCVVDLADKIVWALNNQNEMKIKALRAKEKLVKQYLWRDIAEQYNLVYQELI